MDGNKGTFCHSEEMAELSFYIGSVTLKGRE